MTLFGERGCRVRAFPIEKTGSFPVVLGGLKQICRWHDSCFNVSLMMNQKTTTWFLLAFSLLALVVPAPAVAAISAFKFLGIEGIGSSCAMNSRLGIASGFTEHVINIQDCVDYTACDIEVRWGLDRTPATGTTYAIKVSLPGGACVDNDFTTLGGTCMEEILVDEKTLSSPNYMTFSVPFDVLTGGDCQAGTSKSTKIYIIVKEPGLDPTAEVLMFDVDLSRPPAPEIQEPVEGDSNITVKWTAIDESDDSTTQYNVYWSEATFSNSSKSSATVVGPMSGTSYQIKDLENDKEYFFAVSSIDENDNESVISAVTSGMPIDVSDFWEMYRSSGGQDDGGFCFLATAAWGSYMAPQVMTLRAFRDSVLLTSAPGRAFVSFYYKVSPPLAGLISDSPLLRSVSRLALMPAVILARIALATSLWFAVFSGVALVALTVLFFGVAIRTRRRP